jgi:hypothetical protein
MSWIADDANRYPHSWLPIMLNRLMKHNTQKQQLPFRHQKKAETNHLKKKKLSNSSDYNTLNSQLSSPASYTKNL